MHIKYQKPTSVQTPTDGLVNIDWLIVYRLCRQSAPRESSGRTDTINLRHFSVRVFSVFFPNRKSPNFISYPTILHISPGKFDANSASNWLERSQTQ